MQIDRENRALVLPYLVDEVTGEKKVAPYHPQFGYDLRVDWDEHDEAPRFIEILGLVYGRNRTMPSVATYESVRMAVPGESFDRPWITNKEGVLIWGPSIRFKDWSL